MAQTWANHSASAPPSGPIDDVSIDAELNKSLIVTRAPLERLAVDAIVLPSNLPAGPRVAKAAGAGFERPKVALGKAVASRGLQLPAKRVLHTSLPRFNANYRSACATALTDSATAVLQTAVGLPSPPVLTLALPSLHPEEAGWPQEWACRVVLRALRAWLEKQPRPPQLTVTLCLDTAAELELYEANLPVVFPRDASAPGGASAGGAKAYAAGGAQGGQVSGGSKALLPPAEASRLGGGGSDDWSSGRFAFSREALGVDSAADLHALTADLRDAGLVRFVGLDRAGRPTLLLVGERVAELLTPQDRDLMLLYLLTRIEPLASACGAAGYALLLLHADFNWDMDVAWLQTARARMRQDVRRSAASHALLLWSLGQLDRTTAHIRR